jgi:hypothetical protein
VQVLDQASLFSPFQALTTFCVPDYFISLGQTTSLVAQEAHHEAQLDLTIP